MTATYLSLTNDAIQESGADLASFEDDGSDWNTTTDSLRLKFKKWVARAWKEIQQDSFDLSFMEEQAVVNVDPGFHFYTDGTTIDAFRKAACNGALTTDFTSWLANDSGVNSLDIFDQDGTEAISDIPFDPTINISYSGLTAYTGIVDLTGTATSTKPFGYLNVLTTASTPISWALKPGAEYFQLNNSQVLITHMTQTNAFAADGTYALVLPYSLSPIVILQWYGTPVSAVTDGAGKYNVTFNVPTNTPEAITTAFANGAVIARVDSGSSVTAYSTSGTSALTVTPLAVSTAYIHSWKSFNFSEETHEDDFQENIKEVDQKSFRIINYFQAPPQGEVPMDFVPWEVFQPQYDLSNAPPGIPRIVTRDNTNRFRTYPHPYQKMTLKFDYIRTPQILVDFDDEPKGIDDDITDMIMWRALIMYGEYDEQPSVIARANKNWKNFQLRFDQKYRPKFHFRPARLW